MVIDIEFLIILAEMFSKEFFDEQLFDKFMGTKGARALLEHEKLVGRKVDKFYIKDEIKKIVEEEDYEDRFQLYKVKKSLSQLIDDIEYLRKNKDLIIDKALERVYRIVPEEMDIRIEICLYVGGTDGGFTLNRNCVFINYGNYIGNKEEFIKILSHELYHCRVIPMRYKLKFLFKYISKKKRYAYSILGKIIEEGIACLIQHGAILSKDDLSGRLTRKNLSHSKEQFDILNRILLDIRYGNFDRSYLKRLNVYSIGYLIVTTIYNEIGVLPLDIWTMNLDFKGIINTYNKLCIEKNLPYRFNSETIDWLI